MYKIILLFITLHFFCSNSICQELFSDIRDIPKSNIEFYRTLGDINFPQVWKSILEGDSHFDWRDYEEALSYYLYAYDYRLDEAVLNFRIGVCYYEINQTRTAIKYLKKSFEIDPNVYNDMDYVLGTLYKQIYDFDKAREYFNQYYKRSDTSEIGSNRYRYIEECEFAKASYEKAQENEAINLGDNINSTNDELFPFLINGTDRLLLNIRHFGTGKGFETYYSDYKDNEWTKVKQFNPNRAFKNFKDYRVIYVSCNNDVMIVAGSINDQSNNDWNFYLLKKSGEKWSISEKLDWINIAQNMYSLAFSSNADTLFFGSVEDGKNSDIYMTVIDYKTKTYSGTVNLGKIVNSKANETVISYINDTLYFSSNGLIGLGGYDLYYTIKDNRNNCWSKPVNLGYPINTPFKEMGFTKRGKDIYISSNRENKNKRYDIFLIHLN